MRSSIKYKLFLAILSAHVIVYIAMYSIGRYNFDRGFLEYISRIEERQVPALVQGLSDFYEHTGSWETLKQNPRKWVALIRESIASADEANMVQGRPSSRPVPGGIAPNDWYYSSEYSPARPYLLLLDAGKNILFGNPEALPLATLRPIEARGQTVGFLAVTSRQELSEQADLLFAEQQKQSFLIFAAVLVFISAMVAFPVASVMVRPIRELVAGTRALTSGDYTSRLRPRGSDELARLAEDFNTLAKTLQQNSAARQQWIADISHELRTPLAVLRGELESIQDGVRPLTAESMDSLHHEVVQLTALVNDLHELSMSDLGALIYEKRTVDLTAILDNCIGSHQQMLAQEEIDLDLTVSAYGAGRVIQMLGDETRLSQLFANLLQNTCRYTDHGGQLVVRMQESTDEIVIQWYDSEPGVTDNDLEHLFDRLYRVEGSRNRKGGGSGLGLAICRNIVEAHEGTIEAEHSPLGGLKLIIRFPRRTNQGD